MILPTTDAYGVFLMSFLSSFVEEESLSDSWIDMGSGVDVGFAFSMLKCFNTFCI